MRETELKEVNKQTIIVNNQLTFEKLLTFCHKHTNCTVPYRIAAHTIAHLLTLALPSSLTLTYVRTTHATLVLWSIRKVHIVDRRTVGRTTYETGKRGTLRFDYVTLVWLLF